MDGGRKHSYTAATLWNDLQSTGLKKVEKTNSADLFTIFKGNLKIMFHTCLLISGSLTACEHNLRGFVESMNCNVKLSAKLKQQKSNLMLKPIKNTLEHFEV